MKPTSLLPLLTAISIFVTTSALFGQDVSKKEELAAELLDQQHLQQTIEARYNSMPEFSKQLIEAQKRSPQEIERMHMQFDASIQAAKATSNWTTLKPIYIKVYTENFDEAELQQLVTFYKSPLGQKWVDTQGKVRAAATQVLARSLPAINAAVQKATDESDHKPVVTPSVTP